jgi:hypothetical protein
VQASFLVAIEDDQLMPCLDAVFALADALDSTPVICCMTSSRKPAA